MPPLPLREVRERPQDHQDLTRLAARLSAIATADPLKAPTCRELLKKLSKHVSYLPEAARKAC